jgi:hypothetical protein
MAYVFIGAVSNSKTDWHKWRALLTGTETLDQIGIMACGGAYKWLHVGRMIPEAEYTKELERDVVDRLREQIERLYP